MKIFNRRTLIGFLATLGLFIMLVVPALAQGPAVNFVSVGGHDTVVPGWPRDANFALTAK